MAKMKEKAVKPVKEKRIIREIEEVRSDNCKAYEMSDGSKQLVFYPKAVNAFDEKIKTYEDVNNTFSVEEDGRHYRNEKNASPLALATKTQMMSCSLSKTAYTVSA